MKFSNRIEIDATPKRVFSWLEDPDRAKEWMTSVTKSEIINETPNKIGTTFREHVEEEGRGIEMHGVITEFISDKRFAVHLESDMNSVEVSFILAKHGDITQLTQNVNLRLKGMLKILSLFLRGSIKKKIIRQTQKEFAILKELCEHQD
jgi:carbon monoxide dehydrogenase subunit G